MENKVKKTKFNVIDIIIIVLIVAIVGFSVWFFFLRNPDSSSNGRVNVTYTIVIKEVDSTYVPYFKQYDVLKSSNDFSNLGTITQVSSSKSTCVLSDYGEDKKLIVKEYDSVYDITIVVESLGQLNSLRIPTVGGQELLIGLQLDVVCNSYATSAIITNVTYN